ncbi:hypothetical protein KDW41_12190 [Burkholderia vietnamiensis]|nr:hypothetical protein [Burkholderia vietnamiensis]
MTTTDNSRADALTDEQIEAVQAGIDALLCFPVMEADRHAANVLRSLLAASHVEQPAAAPIDVGVDCLEKLRALMVRLGLTTNESLEGFGATLEDNLYRTIRAMGALVDATATPALSPADERAAQKDGYFVYDPEGNGFELYSTDAERAEAHNTAIKECRRAAIDYGEWPLEVESIVSGIVTHRTIATQMDGDSCDYAARAVSATETGAEGLVAIQAVLREVDPKWRERGEFGVKPHEQIVAAIRDLAESRSPAMAAEAVAIPAGWKTMPPTATAAMRMAMAKAAAEYMQRTGGNSPDAIYEAGFAAAPQPAQADARVGLTMTREQRGVLTRLATVLETGHASNGIADDNAEIYAMAIRALLATPQPEPRAEVTGWSDPCNGCPTPRACQYDGCRNDAPPTQQPSGEGSISEYHRTLIERAEERLRGRSPEDAEAANGLLEVLTAHPVAQQQSGEVTDDKTTRLIKTLSDIIHDQTVAMQSAIIEWQHGKGAEAGLSWIVNTLAGPGHLPDFDAPHGKHAQFWFNENQANPLPTCFCGNPSSSLWMGQGFCCDEHYREAKAKYDAARAGDAS